MEGGNAMKIIVKRIFILILAIILISLSIIAFGNLNDEQVSIYTSFTNEYSLVDKSENCGNALELIYETSTTAYFLNCFKSNSIYLEYADGTIITLREALDGEKVTIESLIEHGLEVTTEPIGSSSVVNE
jgi:uncharacterized protein YxeA